jgi:hypothetical protein
MQLEDLNRGTFGFVQLAYDRVSRQQVAIKFIERGDKVTSWCCAPCPKKYEGNGNAYMRLHALVQRNVCQMHHAVVGVCMAASIRPWCVCAGHKVCAAGDSESQAPDPPTHRGNA